MFNNIVFDFGQVLVRFEPYYMTSVYIKDENDLKIVCDAVFDRKYWDRLDAGSITDDEVIKSFCARLPERLHDAATKVYTNWIYNIPVIKEMKELIQRLKANGKRLFLLSNISIGFAERYTEVPQIFELLNVFDGLVFSGPIGMTKPNKEIFEYLLEKYGLNAEECIFIDDIEKNICGAEKCGIKGYLFDGDSKKLENILI